MRPGTSSIRSCHAERGEQRVDRLGRGARQDVGRAQHRVGDPGRQRAEQRALCPAGPCRGWRPAAATGAGRAASGAARASSAASSATTRTCGRPLRASGSEAQHGDRDVGAQAQRDQRARVVEVHQHVVGGQQRHPAGRGPAEHGRQRQPVGVGLPGERGGGVRLRVPAAAGRVEQGVQAGRRPARRRASSRSGPAPAGRGRGREAACWCRTWPAGWRSPERGAAALAERRYARAVDGGGHRGCDGERRFVCRITALTSPTASSSGPLRTTHRTSLRLT